MNPLAIVGALAVGLSLGLTGAGGSILTLPVLVYLAGVPPAEAVGLSLLVVGSAAATGALGYAREKAFHGGAALMFGASGMLGAVFGSRLTALVSPTVLMGIFSLLMIVVALRMIFTQPDAIAPGPDCRPLKCLSAGLATGVLTGFIGVGGGFLLMPALIRFARLPMRTATGTSLAVIAFNSLAGWLAHRDGGSARTEMGLVFAGIAIAGAWGGRHFSKRLPERRLRQGFAVMVLLTGIVVLVKNSTGL